MAKVVVTGIGFIDALFDSEHYRGLAPLPPVHNMEYKQDEPSLQNLKISWVPVVQDNICKRSGEQRAVLTRTLQGGSS